MSYAYVQGVQNDTVNTINFVHNASCTLAHRYLFKYIIIGDTGIGVQTRVMGVEMLSL